MKIAIELLLNGDSCDVLVRPAETLLDVLRNHLTLMGAKRGCNGGACGACNVLVDGRTVRSCLAIAANMEGQAITTIEGLADGDGTLSIVQQAFLDAGAIQCGFCMPGMIMSVTELLEREPRADRETIRAGIAGNLCRCSGYVKIIQAAELAVTRISSSNANEKRVG